MWSHIRKHIGRRSILRTARCSRVLFPSCDLSFPIPKGNHNCNAPMRRFFYTYIVPLGIDDKIWVAIAWHAHLLKAIVLGLIRGFLISAPGVSRQATVEKRMNSYRLVYRTYHPRFKDSIIYSMIRDQLLYMSSLLPVQIAITPLLLLLYLETPFFCSSIGSKIQHSHIFDGEMFSIRSNLELLYKTYTSTSPHPISIQKLQSLNTWTRHVCSRFNKAEEEKKV